MNTRFEPGAPSSGGSIPLCEPCISGNEWKYIKDCLDTNWVSSAGPYVSKFEQMIAEFTGTKYAVAVVNGTAALHISLILSGVKPDNEVIVPSLTFIAPANAVKYTGAWPVFMDSDPDYWQLDCDKLDSFLSKECKWENKKLINRSTLREIKAVIPIHILGHPCDMGRIVELADKYCLKIIEDATESLGASFDGKKTGTFGDFACFSFNGNKIITTGGGGMIATDSSELAEKARYLTTQAKDDPLEYVHNEVGFNYRLTNIQAAMGCAQMENLNEYIKKKKLIANIYTNAFKNTAGIYPMKQAPWADSIFWLYTILIDEKDYGMNSRELLRKLAGMNIQTRPLWQPMHLSSAHGDCQSYHCDTAEMLNRKAISLPCSVGLTEAQQSLVIAAMESI